MVVSGRSPGFVASSMLFRLTRQEKHALTTLALLIVLGFIGLAVLG